MRTATNTDATVDLDLSDYVNAIADEIKARIEQERQVFPVG
jgi:hypothetical protein